MKILFENEGFCLNSLRLCGKNPRYVFIISFANILWIKYLFRKFAKTSLFFREFAMNLLSFSQIQYEVTSWFAHTLWIYLIKIKCESTILVTNILWIHYLFRGFTMNQIYSSRINYLFANSEFAKKVDTYYLFHDFILFFANLL